MFGCGPEGSAALAWRYRYCDVRNSLASLSERTGTEFDVGGFVGDYLERMGMSHFCLIPMGSPR